MTGRMLIVGAGPNIGMSLARRFGREGWAIGLIARSADKLRGYAAELDGLGIRNFQAVADVTDRPGLRHAVRQVSDAMGGVDVLEYSPLLDMFSLVNVLELDDANVQAQIDMQVLGPIACVSEVIGGMLERGSGGLLFTLGATAYLPAPSHANGAVSVAAAREYINSLHTELKPKGIYVGSLAIGQYPDGDAIADIYWEKVQEKGRCETLFGDPRVHAAYEIMISRGIAAVYPPRLTGALPPIDSEYERNLQLVVLHHLVGSVKITGEDPDEKARLTQLALERGGDLGADHYGGGLDMIFPPIATI